jgi:hypothetical protein
MEQKASGPTAELARRDNEREEKERRKRIITEVPGSKRIEQGNRRSRLFTIFS